MAKNRKETSKGRLLTFVLKFSLLKHTHVLFQNFNNLLSNLLDRRGGQFAGFSRTKSKITLSTIPISYPSNLPQIPFQIFICIKFEALEIPQQHKDSTWIFSGLNNDTSNHLSNN